ncbi:hypothetical protein ABIB15_001030 [Marisediminicola sp. UYEF4]|uniref:flavodoxin family protein n=1 Tax=Marisediminicola sp. UYEF4 TaxID=1756384 RepID=UPI003395A5D3
MHALVVYESLWGNTEQIARAVAAELATKMDVEVVEADTAPVSLEGIDLLLVGGPTHAFSMSRSTTRESAVSDHAAPHAPGRGIREWLADVVLPHATKAATFDTRVNAPRLPGSAAKAAKQELRSLGAQMVVKKESFRVQGYGGPLIDGELERAAEWARSIVNAAMEGSVRS